MNFRQLREYCSSKAGVEETFPFSEEVLVFKVAGKMFALTNLVALPLSVNLKCDPDRAVELRERYAAVQPGYHMNKTHWNTVEIDGSVADEEVYGWIDDSYTLVVRSLKRADREALMTKTGKQ